ncbi:MAG: hypothetical protein D6719_12630 [Candidatus Dadabacteria bacterium]|nr:MAG: hypothetical protein D6719_12630 [Candidatus Dadabacteria bacterium]
MKKFVNLLILHVFLALTAVSCSSRKSADQFMLESQVAEARMASYGAEESMPVRPQDQLAPGYRLKISSGDDSNINGVFRIAYDGTLKLPYNIKVKAAGLTLSELKSKVIKAYAPFFKVTPSIALRVIDRSRYVEVAGLVEKPGHYLVKKSDPLDVVLAKAGGLKRPDYEDNSAVARFVRIEQLGKSRTVKLADYYAGATSLIPQWQGGDRIFFQSERAEIAEVSGGSSKYVQVIGQVRSPGDQLYQPGADFFHYLVAAGGPTDRADLERVAIIRNLNGKRRTLVFSVTDKKQPELRGGDVLLVYGDNATHFERSTGVGASIASMFTGIASLVLLAF